MNGIAILEGDVLVRGKPAYRIVRPIGHGGSSLCYLARKYDEDGRLQAYCVLKEFCPKALQACLVRSAQDGRLTLRPDSSLQGELEQLRCAFLGEASLCRSVNLAASRGENNFSGVLYCETVPGRDDLLCIATEEGYTLHEFINRQYTPELDRDYVLLCLMILSNLLAVLEGIHRSVLHMDVNPKNVYLVTQDCPLSSESALSVKLLDLASARPKAAMPSMALDRCLLPYTEGFSDPDMLDAPELADERSDWYSAAACLYTMLTNQLLPGGDSELFFVTLPDTGALSDQAFREELEALLNCALKLSQPFTAQEVAQGAFRKRVLAFISTLRSQSAHSGHAPQSGSLFDDAPSPPVNSTLSTFTPQERRLYDMQVTIYNHHLERSRDELNGYSCHAQPHIEEVMEETDKLFMALRPWLREQLPGDDLNSIREHLLLGAKLHDIGMSGSEEMRQLLTSVDTQFSLVQSGAQGTFARYQEQYNQMQHLAQALSMKTPGYAAVTMHAHAFGVPGQTGRLKSALAAYHDEIKQQIRLRHGDTSGQYILSRRDELAAHYGSEINWVEVALLAALHTGSADDAALAYPRVSKAYMLDFVRRYGQSGDVAQVEARWQRILMEASILRVADGRRSGSRLLMLNLARPVIFRSADGRLELRAEKDGITRHIPFAISHDILLAERLVELGGVALQRTADGGWLMTHELLLHHADTKDARRLFLNRRIPAYTEELCSALLRPNHMRHILMVRGEDGSGTRLSAQDMDSWLKTAQAVPGFTLRAGE
ncbi:MAG: hypothetical protein ACI4MJ_11315 [Aristaeellaceae bacterium]